MPSALAMDATSIDVLAPAKLNLYLGIYPGRDERGYHRADSVMIGVALADRVHIEKATKVLSNNHCASSVAPSDASAACGRPAYAQHDSLPNTTAASTQTSPIAQSNRSAAPELSLTTSVDCGVPQQRNTVFRAAQALCQALGHSEGYAIHLQKNVPSQAGMGGASSDAASTLLGLCRLWGVDPLDERVVAVARSIGADVPFFLTMSPALLVGAGDVLAQTFPDLPDVPVVLVRPDVGVSTVEAYRAFDSDPITPPSPDAMCAALQAGDARAVAQALYNNLEPAANRLAPETAEVHEWLADQPGVMAAQLTGSGSCVFGLCESHQAAQRIAQDAQETRNWWSYATTTVGAGAQFC